MDKTKEFELASRRGRQTLAEHPRAVSARFDSKSKRIVIALSSGVEVSFLPAIVQGLENASPQQLRDIQILPPGLGTHFPRLDADIYIPALLSGIFGSKKWMASQLGAEGGRSTSAAKVRAARANGRLGGRPKPVGVTKRKAVPVAVGRRSRVAITN